MAIVVKFTGGFKDGQELRSDSPNPNEAQTALVKYVMAGEGKPGKRFKAFSDAAIDEFREIAVVDGDTIRLTREPTTAMNHIYEVTSREEVEGDVIVRFEYRGQHS